MQSLRVLSRCLKEALLVKPHFRFTSSSSLPNPILVDMDEQEELEPDEHLEAHPQYPLLGNRYIDHFYMPCNVGPAYQDLVTTADQFDLTKYYNSLGWYGVKPIRAQVVPCPKLLLNHMKQQFVIPCEKLAEPINFSIFNLYFEGDVNSAIKSFVLIASQYATEFMQDGYWSDFVNPFTGRAYFRPSARRKLLNEESASAAAASLGHNMRFKNVNGCTVIKEAKKCTFAGAIFSDVPVSLFE
ncbi:uncharacterized protein LOC132790360 [Drosophila nasuta]|uniref:uncharacterized protein LOC132790360 n=1 Tax=Drosophila nasuta TaxID=42062 RepID=UPI00295ECC11|nr:uncharacterized protein LOC132790360 [Drosophila nasuta]